MCTPVLHSKLWSFWQFAWTRHCGWCLTSDRGTKKDKRPLEHVLTYLLTYTHTHTDILYTIIYQTHTHIYIMDYDNTVDRRCQTYHYFRIGFYFAAPFLGGAGTWNLKTAISNWKHMFQSKKTLRVIFQHKVVIPKRNPNLGPLELLWGWELIPAVVKHLNVQFFYVWLLGLWDIFEK